MFPTLRSPCMKHFHFHPLNEGMNLWDICPKPSAGAGGHSAQKQIGRTREGKKGKQKLKDKKVEEGKKNKRSTRKKEKENLA